MLSRLRRKLCFHSRAGFFWPVCGGEGGGGRRSSGAALTHDKMLEVETGLSCSSARARRCWTLKKNTPLGCVTRSVCFKQPSCSSAHAHKHVSANKCYSIAFLWREMRFTQTYTPRCMLGKTCTAVNVGVIHGVPDKTALFVLLARPHDKIPPQHLSRKNHERNHYKVKQRSAQPSQIW